MGSAHAARHVGRRSKRQRAPRITPWGVAVLARLRPGIARRPVDEGQAGADHDQHQANCRMQADEEERGDGHSQERQCNQGAATPSPLDRWLSIEVTHRGV